MTGGRDSDYQLIVDSQQGGILNLVDGEYRFAGGTHVAGGTLAVTRGGTLVSDVVIYNTAFASGGTLWLSGTVRGNVQNDGLFTTLHVCGTGLGLCANDPRSRIEGDFTQSWSGILELVLGWPLEVTGRVELDGYLHLVPGSSESYVLPTASTSVLLLHAGEGVTGRFRDWTLSGLFLEGTLRYTTHDVFFDAARISLVEGAKAQGMARPVTLAGAANLERALTVADTFATAPRTSLHEHQRQFLASATSLLWLQDPAQAERSFDSLAGHAHAGAGDLLLAQSALVAARLDARLSRLPHAPTPLSWSDAPGLHVDGHLLEGRATGIDLWLTPRLLVGGGVSDSRVLTRFDHLGGGGMGGASLASIHAHYRTDGWHATGSLAAGRAWLPLQRTIEPGPGRHHVAHSTRQFGHASLHGEIGRDLALGNGRLVPFASLDYGLVHSTAFIERGDSGLELVGEPGRQARLTGTVGARYGHDWTQGARPLRLELDLRHSRDLSGGDPLLAAFRGVPEVRFALPQERGRAATSLRLGLGGWFAPRSRWSLDYAREAGRHDASFWRLGLQHAF